MSHHVFYLKLIAQRIKVKSMESMMERDVSGTGMP